MSALIPQAAVVEALASVVQTLRETANQVDDGAEFPSLTIDPEARDGYSHACHDIADAIERRSIGGGILRQMFDAEGGS